MIATNINILIPDKEIEKRINRGDTQLKIELIKQKKHFPRLSDLEYFIREALRYEDDIQLFLTNIPFCLLSNIEDRLFRNNSNLNKTKIKACLGCRYNMRCGGIYPEFIEIIGEKNIKPVVDLPREVMIEIEPRCNLNCNFCFNKNSFAKNGRNIKSLTTIEAKKIITATATAGVKIIRFTGGEPLLREDIFDLMNFSKEAGLKIRLNTNGLLINKPSVIKKIGDYVSSVLIPIEGSSNEDEYEITGVKNAFDQKIQAVKLLKQNNTFTVRAGTVATKKNIKNLEKIYEVIKNLGFSDWEVYRPIPSPDNKQPISRRDVKTLVDKLILFSNQSGKSYNIVNGIPFCAYDMELMNKVSTGALPVDGHIRYAVDPRGYAKPDYYIDKNIGDPSDVLGCWNHPFMKKIRNLKYVPDECKGCEYLLKCRGGSRYSAMIANGDFKSKDPLMKQI